MQLYHSIGYCVSNISCLLHFLHTFKVLDFGEKKYTKVNQTSKRKAEKVGNGTANFILLILQGQ